MGRGWRLWQTKTDPRVLPESEAPPVSGAAQRVLEDSARLGPQPECRRMLLMMAAAIGTADKARREMIAMNRRALIHEVKAWHWGRVNQGVEPHCEFFAERRHDMKAIQVVVGFTVPGSDQTFYSEQHVDDLTIKMTRDVDSLLAHAADVVINRFPDDVKPYLFEHFMKRNRIVDRTPLGVMAAPEAEASSNYWATGDAAAGDVVDLGDCEDIREAETRERIRKPVGLGLCPTRIDRTGAYYGAGC